MTQSGPARLWSSVSFHVVIDRQHAPRYGFGALERELTDRDDYQTSLSVPPFHETKERSDKTLQALLHRAADAIV
jgi:hypothetical protein